LFYFCTFTGFVIIIGYSLSSMDQLASLAHWCIVSTLLLFVVSIIALSNANLRRSCLQKVSLPRISALTDLKDWYSQLSFFYKATLGPLMLTAIVVNLANLVLILFSAPSNWDSMTYHLARVAYYIQHGNLSYFDANYWAQVVHPKNSAVLMLYSFLVGGRNESLTQLVQFASYLVAILAVYGISRRVGFGKQSSLFSSLVFALLIECLMESSTTQNDMLIAAYIACAAYFVLSWGETPARKYIVAASIATGLAIGVKASALLALPSLLVIAVYVSVPKAARMYRLGVGNLAFSLILAVVGLCTFCLPSGYLENYAIFGNPLGSKEVTRIHSFGGESVGYILSNGSKNVVRFAFEFLSLDGLPPERHVRQAQRLIRKLPEKIMRSLGIDLETTQGCRAAFTYEKPPRAQEGGSYWGIFGFALIWPVLLLLALGIIRSPPARVLSIATILFLLVQSYSGPYDPWRGRHFLVSAVFAAPVVGCFLDCLNNKNSPLGGNVRTRMLLNVCLVGIVIVGCVSAGCGVAFREHRALFTIDRASTQSVLSLDRLVQLTANRPSYYGPLQKYEALVPENAVVAVYLGDAQYEYPLFGERLTRTIIPVRSVWKDSQSACTDVEYLLFSDSFLRPIDTDIHLGEDWYLRDCRDTP